VMEGDDWRHVMLLARLEHPPIVVERGPGELSLGRLDARPLDAETESVQPEAGEH
jgi:hypothetical protein